MINAMIINEKDNVVVAIEEIKKGDEVSYKNKDKTVSFKALDNIKIYHKIAIKDIETGNPILKYGEHMGLASAKITVGNHVHTHNVKDNRENLH